MLILFAFKSLEEKKTIINPFRQQGIRWKKTDKAINKVF
jgi:hypothetical protein